MSVPRSVTITYYDPFGIYPHIIKDIQSRLPLRNLRWNNPPRPVRFISSLSVNLEEESLGDDLVLQHQIPGLLDTPYMKFILVKCEDNDTYKTSVRKIIREWFSSKVASKRDSTEWMILYYEPAGSSSGSNSALRFKTGGFEKIKADFNTSPKEDRCVLVKASQSNVNGSSGLDDTEFWNDVLNRIKDGVLKAFGRRVQMYEEEVSKLEAKKSIPGWNFATFFVMKEGLALSFQSVSLLEDALIQYDELDATFMQLMRGNNVNFFQTVGFSPESATRLLDDERNNDKIRHDILENNISLFDFRCYLFSRQASILLLLMSLAPSPSVTALRIADFLVRTRNFTLETSKMLAFYGKSPLLIANWVFGIVQEVMDATEVQPAVIQGGHTRDVAEGRADLLLLSRSSIERLARRKGWTVGDEGLEDIDIDSSTPILPEDDELLASCMYPKLKEILETEESFMNSYMEHTEIAQSLYESADRTRSVDKLRAQMAIVRYRQKNYAETVRLLASLPQLYSSQGWEVISTNLFMIYADCLEHLDRKDDCVNIYKQALANRGHSSVEQFADICKKIMKLCVDLENESTFLLSSLFTTSVSKMISVSSEQDDSFYITLTIHNPFPVDWKGQSASVRLIEPSGMKHTVLFRSDDDLIILPGENHFRLRTNHNNPGVYAIDNIEVRIGKLVLVLDYFGEQPLENQVMRLYQQPGNMDVNLSTPSRMRLDDPKRVIVEIQTGWNDVEEAKVTARSASTGLRLSVEDAVASIKTENTDTKFDVAYVANSASQLEFGAADAKELYIRVQIEFKRADTNQFYSLSVMKHVSISLSLAVNVQDIFKVSCLFSRFSISCIGSSTPLRIISGTLDGTAEFDVEGGKGPIVSYVAFPKQPVTYSFRITRNKSTAVSDRPSPLCLEVKYRRLEDEVRHTISHVIKEKLVGIGAAKYSSLIGQYLQTIARCDLAVYGFMGELNLGDYDKSQWNPVLAQVEPQYRQLIENALGEVYQSISKAGEEELSKYTKELLIPVEVPTVQVLFTVELQYADKSAGVLQKANDWPSQSQHAFTDRVFYIGQPIQVNLRLSASNTWTPSGDEKDVFRLGNVEFAYEVIANSDTWIISGKRKGHFIVSKEVLNCALTILPVRHGNLLLPRIDVRPSQHQSEPISAEVDYVNSAESVLVLPEVSNVVLAVGE